MSDSTRNECLETGPERPNERTTTAACARLLVCLPGRLHMAAVLVLLALGLALGSAPAVRAAQLVMFDSRFCPWCLRWKREIGIIYDKTEEGKKAPLRIVDRDGPRPDDLRHIKGIYWTPTFVLLDDEGREVGRIEGYQNEYAFWSQLGELLKKLEARKTSDSDGTMRENPAKSGTKAPANG